jgi:hypothetical protein
MGAWELNILILRAASWVRGPFLVGGLFRDDGLGSLSRATGIQERGFRKAKKSGLNVATLISTSNPVSQVLW